MKASRLLDSCLPNGGNQSAFFSATSALNDHQHVTPGNSAEKVTLLFRMGMSGNVMHKPADEPYDKHCHLRFEDKSGAAVCYMDYRRFGTT